MPHLEGTNQITPWQGVIIFTNTVLQKALLKKYSGVTKHTHHKTALVKKTYSGKQKHTPVPERKVGMFFSTQKVEFDLVLVFKITFCWDILFGTLLLCFLTSVKR
jgi:hypothetical protein